MEDAGSLIGYPLYGPPVLFANHLQSAKQSKPTQPFNLSNPRGTESNTQLSTLSLSNGNSEHLINIGLLLLLYRRHDPSTTTLCIFLSLSKLNPRAVISRVS